MRARLLTTLVLAGALAAAALAGCGGGNDAEPVAARPVRYAYARSLFREICAGCHRLVDAGAYGGTKGMSSDLDAFLREYFKTRAQLVNATLRTGQGGSMPGWKDVLSSTELQALARYLVRVADQTKHSGDGRLAKTLTPMRDPLHPPKDRMAYGRALFKQICAGCHTLADAGAHGSRYDLDYNYSTISEHEKRIRAHRGLRGFPPFMPNWEHWLPKEQIEVLTDYVATVAGKAS